MRSDAWFVPEMRYHFICAFRHWIEFEAATLAGIGRSNDYARADIMQINTNVLQQLSINAFDCAVNRRGVEE